MAALSVLVSGERWAEPQLCCRAAPDNQMPSWASGEMDRKGTGGRKEHLFVPRKGLPSPQETGSEAHAA